MNSLDLYMQDISEDTKVNTTGNTCDIDRSWVEALFEVEATKRGFQVSRITTRNARYDCIIDKNYTLSRVQVKSSSSLEYNSYKICLLHHGRNTPHYTIRDIDFLAAYIIPKDMWYIFPAEIIPDKYDMRVIPDNHSHEHARYREAWYLLDGNTMQATL